MNEKLKLKLVNTLLLSAKIGIGSSVAIYIAELLHLQYATSAGIITLLTLTTTRWGTFRLSLQRVLTYVASVGACWLIFHVIPSVWVEYGIFLFFNSCCLVYMYSRLDNFSRLFNSLSLMYLFVCICCNLLL